ncbi:MAG: Flagellar motor protein MotB [Thermodesulfobacterium sp.]|uniref:Flagellar motor protein MotB n=1 Tax=Candidatus Thermodesulfobacterium syntrophicum TaxID=3060442 RepID=A0AAE3P3V2_9BACT|nr:Flagellar motor protein MotB [Candidatus Thermodesulfobacterium syntrophicum]
MSTPPIIIKKVKKIVAGHHGGSWKVAYADFLAGMMTFFLLMWLITIMEPKQKAQVAAYFRKFNIFQKAGISMLMEYYKSGKITSSKMKTISQEIPPVKGQAEFFKRIIETYLKSLKEHILIEIDKKRKTVRLEIIELVNKPLFYSGSAELTPEAKKILAVLAKELRDMHVTIEVEGHTDAVPSRRGKLGNWELSTARALSAMLELEKNGVPPEKIISVAGYADNFPLFKDNPLDPRNRRITLVIKFQSGSPLIYKAKKIETTY